MLELEMLNPKPETLNPKLPNPQTPKSPNPQTLSGKEVRGGEPFLDEANLAFLGFGSGAWLHVPRLAGREAQGGDRRWFRV